MLRRFCPKLLVGFVTGGILTMEKMLSYVPAEVPADVSDDIAQ